MSFCILSARSASTALPTGSWSSTVTIDAMTMESRMTLCNMAIEAGGTSGICQPDMTTVDFLWPFIQGEFAARRPHWPTTRNGPPIPTPSTIR